MRAVKSTHFSYTNSSKSFNSSSVSSRISPTGMIRQELHVVLDQKMINEMNQKIADTINGKIDEAASELHDKKQELEDAQKELESAKEQLESGKDTLINQTAQAGQELDNKIEELATARKELEAQLAIEAKKERVISAQEVTHFLSVLQKSNFDDPLNRRAVINIFLNKIYLYDDKFRLVLNGSGQPVEIDNIMLDEIDDYFDSQISDSAECSSMVADAPPYGMPTVF